ncbi:MAG: glycoside hydrolase family 3 C-terminal domain-containing protein [Promethearchaeia archaeon]
MVEEISEEELKKLPFMNSNLDLEERVDDLLQRLTIEEKFKLCSGTRGFETRKINSLGIKPFKMTDGPHGIAFDSSIGKLGTYFPTAICRSATWNPELSRKFGIALAEEVRDIGYHMLLGPGINIIRTPLCGRNFEYQTEDPFLNIKMAIPVVKGIQSQKIAACAKHYICNNQETNRLRVSSEISERALQEIYLPAFKAVVKEGKVWSIMSCYNKINGIYGSENKELLRERLMENWGFLGFVVSDWEATTYINKTEDCVNAGLTLEMPIARRYRRKRLKDALTGGKFNEKTINSNLKRLLRVMFFTGLFDNEDSLPSGSRNSREHQIIARKIAEEGIVLLKNDNNLLPLNLGKLKTIAVLGPNVDKKMAYGGGSSGIQCPYEITPLQGIKEMCKEKVEINNSPADADVAIIVAGFNHDRGMDSEFVDRKWFNLPEDQIRLINKVVNQNSNTIVILINGGPIGMEDWIDKVPVLVEAWYPGMEGGHAIANIIFGDVNPSGKLPVSFPKRLTDSPAHKSSKTYPGNDKVYYEEGIFVGYRYFDNYNIEPLFPFGYGLSYTEFNYENLKIDKFKFTKGERINISIDIINSGGYYGAEIVQLYIQDIESSVERPIKELKGFKKVNLKPNEKSTLKFELSEEDFAFFDESINSWRTEKGLFNVLIGSSSRDIRLQAQVEYISIE